MRNPYQKLMRAISDTEIREAEIELLAAIQLKKAEAKTYDLLYTLVDRVMEEFPEFSASYAYHTFTAAIRKVVKHESRKHKLSNKKSSERSDCAGALS